MIRHILFITFTESVSSGQCNAIRQAFLHIPQQVEGVTSVEWGTNDSPEAKNAGFTHCVLMTFADESSRQRYLIHPAHNTLKSIFRPALRNIAVLDYTLQPDNAAGW